MSIERDKYWNNIIMWILTKKHNGLLPDMFDPLVGFINIRWRIDDELYCAFTKVTSKPIKEKVVFRMIRDMIHNGVCFGTIYSAHSSIEFNGLFYTNGEVSLTDKDVDAALNYNNRKDLMCFIEDGHVQYARDLVSKNKLHLRFKGNYLDAAMRDESTYPHIKNMMIDYYHEYFISPYKRLMYWPIKFWKYPWEYPT